VTLAVAVFSYAGQLNLTAVADQDTCPDLEVFAEGVRSALDGLARSMLVAASRGGVRSIADTLADNSYARRGALERAATAISEPDSSTRAACLRPIR
jgi:hypothetical protein